MILPLGWGNTKLAKKSHDTNRISNPAHSVRDMDVLSQACTAVRLLKRKVFCNFVICKFKRRCILYLCRSGLESLK